MGMRFEIGYGSGNGPGGEQRSIYSIYAAGGQKQENGQSTGVRAAARRRPWQALEDGQAAPSLSRGAHCPGQAVGRVTTALSGEGWGMPAALVMA